MRIPAKPPKWEVLLENQGEQNLLRLVGGEEVRHFVQTVNEKYLPWDKVRHLSPPAGLSSIQAWGAIALSRRTQLQSLPITFGKKSRLQYWIPPQQQEWISTIDRQAAGMIGSDLPIPRDNDRYLFNSLMEEAIASSQLEGASTTRKVAKEMLQSKRTPRDKAEQMILNNYHAILEIRDLQEAPLTPELLCHLQRILTEKTIEPPEAAGRFRNSNEVVVVADNASGESLYEPPVAGVVSERVREICEFANSKSTPFVHPIIKAMAIHFALGYVHPFVDGNGRTARAIFYWYMLKSGYWLFEYLPISRIILGSPIRYGKAYLYTETDRGDLTYFNYYHLKIINRAIADLHEYLEKQKRELLETETLLLDHPELNWRQRSLIQEALKNQSSTYTVRQYEGKYQVTYNTARSDLLKLVELKFIQRIKPEGTKEATYRPASNLAKQLKKEDK